LILLFSCLFLPIFPENPDSFRVRINEWAFDEALFEVIVRVHKIHTFFFNGAMVLVAG